MIAGRWILMEIKELLASKISLGEIWEAIWVKILHSHLMELI
jgi:hypothetical protein